MSRFLLIETSTERGVFGLSQDEKILFCEELPFGMTQSRFLMPRLAEFIQQNSLRSEDLTFIGIGTGPGSYTGIRVGMAVAQALSYSWKIPLVGVSSLDGFVPSKKNVPFAAIIDARIGGAYVRKGILTDQGIDYLCEPSIYSLAELGTFLKDVKILVTPFFPSLKLKLEKQYPDLMWTWEEKAPSLDALAHRMNLAYRNEAWRNKGHLELLYLKETEAEREKNKSSS
ncbi:tRNA (adenosine(37)-N6)-threonylcarbamoyltransferase complex dimerization subunit type 1 TsaB [Candidatus Protochlamydia amoebophila]|uniref:Gcp-like domain-containing protein n=2 Tax=Candidatus Protochlamydia amoebophila TaxID=362787 RepID=A0A2P9H9F5_PARUW|nr:tRNA (adenosine(37)-N6)-threonylcarbamoyltransferase complex dimerization subunit type 1 TsaB [Candidatus Protochlamydia amoebophila]KIC73408.1 Uncharacterized protein YeaZ [Candidatus Protochlamydia amoebophila]SPJ31633.1 unnamed protein product [Candidatus Protochlamydia amoebophila UWE25]